MKGGRCLLHGPGAAKKWMPKKTAIVGEGGKVTMRYVGEREYYWKCDIGKKNKLRQTTLTFLKTTSTFEDNPSGDRRTTPTLRNSDASVGQGDKSVQRLELN